MNACLADGVRSEKAATGGRAQCHDLDVGQDYVWICSIAGRVVGTVGLRGSAADAAEICLFHVDPEWQHTSVPGKLMQCIRSHAWQCGFSRLLMAPRVMPRWLLLGLRRRGFHFVGSQRALGAHVLEFRIAP